LELENELAEEEAALETGLEPKIPFCVRPNNSGGI